MKTKSIVFFIILALFFVVLIACSNSNFDDYPPGDTDSDEIALLTETSIERKIIYKATAKIDTKDLSSTISKIRQNLESDEWFDEESISDKSAFFIIRVKSSRLDLFIASLSENGSVRNLHKTATDVSLSYQDTSNQIASLNAERARLLVLFENATLSEMINLNTRISKLDLDISKLQGTLNQYDSLLDYSEIRLNIYEVYTIEKSPFINRLSNAFYGGWSALTTIVEWLLLVIVALSPFILVFTPIGLGTYFIYKHIKKRKNQKKNTE